MKGNQEDWAELLNLWPLVEHEAQQIMLSTHMKLAAAGDTPDLCAVRVLQGKMEGIKAVLAIPRRVIEVFETQRKEERDG